MSDSILSNIPYEFFLFEGEFVEYSHTEPNKKLGIGLVDLPIIVDSFALVQNDDYIGIALPDKLQNVDNFAESLSDSYIGIALSDSVQHNDNFADGTSDNYIGIALSDSVQNNDNFADGTSDPYIGIALTDNIISTDNFADGTSDPYIGIALTDNIISTDNFADGTSDPYIGIALTDDPSNDNFSRGTSKPKFVLTSSADIINPQAWLRFKCDSNKINILKPSIIPDNWLFSNLSSYKNIEQPRNKRNPSSWDIENLAKDKNNPMNPEKEAPRLLTHLIFDPIYKPALSTYYITYTLQIEVERTIEHNLNYHYVFSQSFENTNNFTIVHNMNTLLNAHILVNDQLINPVSITNNINEIVITLDEKLSGMVKLYDDIGLDTFTHSTKEYIFDYEQYDLSDTWTIYHYLELTMNADVFINGIKTIPKHISNDDNSKMIITFEKPMNGIAKLF